MAKSGDDGADWFKRADLPNGEGYSGVALTKALADLSQQGVLEPWGEKRGRQYRLRTEYLEKVFAGISDDDGQERPQLRSRQGLLRDEPVALHDDVRRVLNGHGRVIRWRHRRR